MQPSVISSLRSDNGAVVEAKRKLRRQMRRARAGIALDQRACASVGAARHLAQLARDLGSRVAALYASSTDELGTVEADAALRRHGLTLAYPRIVRDERRLTFHRVDELAALRAGALGIPEPDRDAPRVPVEHIDLFVVPGLAFDPSGNRLGWGQGYYDRLLAGVRRATRVGFAYGSQVVNDTPITERDVAMDHIVTELGILDCRPHAALRELL
jgi:5-formyltetrahydrofolate cyclo-ligase